MNYSDTVDFHKRRYYKAIAGLIVLSLILGLSWVTVWNRQEAIGALQDQLETARADAAELRAELGDAAREGEYFRAYSFQIVMGTIIKKARQYRVPINTALALCQIESGWNPFAISSTGDYGLYQMNERAHVFDKQKIFTPEVNIDMGLRYLRKCYDQAGDWSMAAALYNAGKNYQRSDHPRKLSESIFMQGQGK